jgi:hypothetical protein
MANRQLQRFQLPETLLQRLLACNLKKVSDVFSKTDLELVELLDLSYEEVAQICRTISVISQPTSVGGSNFIICL